MKSNFLSKNVAPTAMDGVQSMVYVDYTSNTDYITIDSVITDG